MRQIYISVAEERLSQEIYRAYEGIVTRFLDGETMFPQAQMASLKGMGEAGKEMFSFLSQRILRKSDALVVCGPSHRLPDTVLREIEVAIDSHIPIYALDFTEQGVPCMNQVYTGGRREVNYAQ